VTGLATALAGKASTSHTHVESDIIGLVADLAAKAAAIHSHTSSQIGDATANATASTVVMRDGSGGANFAYIVANNLWAYLDSHFNSVECGPFGTRRRTMASGAITARWTGWTLPNARRRDC
jgi:hypothetical protein